MTRQLWNGNSSVCNLEANKKTLLTYKLEGVLLSVLFLAALMVT